MASPPLDSSTHFSSKGLSPSLGQRHIIGIAISGTIGAGLFITSGEILALSGSLGASLAYAVAGCLVLSVMLCLGEMISRRPSPGAFFDFPAFFVDESLGFATSWAYWLAYTCSCCTLTVDAAMILKYWNGISLPLAILIVWVPVILFNFTGRVIYYGWLELIVSCLKVILIVVVSFLMIVIAAGVRGPGEITIQSPSQNWGQQSIFPPGFCFSGAYNCSTGDSFRIQGNFGIFLGVWTSTANALFAFIGVEIVVIAAAEAKNTKRDLPLAARRIVWFAIAVYLLLMVLGFLNVAYDDPALLQYAMTGSPNVSSSTLHIFPLANDSSIVTGDRSPFVIALKRAGFYSTLPGVLNSALLFTAMTAANTAFYVASRTLYQLCSGGKIHPAVRDTLGSTSSEGLPLWAIGTTVTVSALAFIGTVENPDQIVSVVSRISVTSILCVYISQCMAFIRYKIADRQNLDTNNRRHEESRRVKWSWPVLWRLLPALWRLLPLLWRLLPAIMAIFLGSLLLVSNGWSIIYEASHPSKSPGFGKVAAGLIGSYFGPILFLTLFSVHKQIHGTRFVPESKIRRTVAE